MAKTIFLFFLYSSVMFSQNISGTVYDSEAPVSGAKIMNITSKSITSTDGDGNFKIYAKINDTLIFSSLFHHTKQFVITGSQYEAAQVFELKKIVNELNEIELLGAITQKEIDEKVATEVLNRQFKSDVEKNPHLYRRANTNSGPIDFIEIGRRVGKLFKRKNGNEIETVETFISSDNFNTLFKTDKFFNDTFLLLDLNITKDYKHLFFAFCETKDMPSNLLRPENKIYLIEHFLDYGKEFREILKESQNN